MSPVLVLYHLMTLNKLQGKLSVVPVGRDLKQGDEFAERVPISRFEQRQGEGPTIAEPSP